MRKLFWRNRKLAGKDTEMNHCKKQPYLLTGFLRRHFRHIESLIRIVLSAIHECRFFEEEETPSHLATEWPAFVSYRRQSFDSEDCRVDELTSLMPLQILDFNQSLEFELWERSVRGHNRFQGQSRLWPFLFIYVSRHFCNIHTRFQ